MDDETIDPSVSIEEEEITPELGSGSEEEEV